MSDETVLANAENSNKSPGPITPEGKRRSSLNARRHQLTSKVYIAPPEEMEAFDAHCKSWLEALAPGGLIETEIATEIAQDRWRLKRARAIENSIFAQGHNDHADSMNSGAPAVDSALAEGKTWTDQAPRLSLLTVYEGRIRRSIEKNTTQLESLQAARKQAYAHAQREAIRLVQLAKAEGETYDIAADFLPARDHGGFVFSLPALIRVFDREQRISRSWDAVNRAPTYPKAA